MDSETISTFKTVCTAGCAREGFNCESNSRLEQLANVGLLVLSHAPALITRRHTYKPSEKGWAMYKELGGDNAA
jgi:hypothetical protein